MATLKNGWFSRRRAIIGVFVSGPFFGCEESIKTYEGVKESVGKDCMVVVHVVSGCVFSVNMESYDGV
jgi:hypothetical protein